MAQRRRFSAKFKTQVILDFLTGRRSMAQVCSEHNLKEQVVTRWRATFWDRAELLFDVDTKQEEYLERIAELERLVGQLTKVISEGMGRGCLLPRLLETHYHETIGTLFVLLTTDFRHRAFSSSSRYR
jgi:transposase-like protein